MQAWLAKLLQPTCQETSPGWVHVDQRNSDEARGHRGEHRSAQSGQKSKGKASPKKKNLLLKISVRPIFFRCKNEFSGKCPFGKMASEK